MVGGFSLSAQFLSVFPASLGDECSRETCLRLSLKQAGAGLELPSASESMRTTTVVGRAGLENVEDVPLSKEGKWGNVYLVW